MTRAQGSLVSALLLPPLVACEGAQGFLPRQVRGAASIHEARSFMCHGTDRREVSCRKMVTETRLGILAYDRLECMAATAFRLLPE